jgi:hypothetical protein
MQADLPSERKRQAPAQAAPASSPASFSAADAVGLLTHVIGSPTVTLRGFSRASAVKRVWSHPTYAFIPAPMSPMDLVAPLQHAKRHRMWLTGLAAAAAAVMTFTLGAVLAGVRVNQAAVRAVRSDPAASSWAIAGLERQAVIVKTRGANIRVHVGDKLPNGDLVVSISQERNTVLLSSGTLFLHPATAQVPRK